MRVQYENGGAGPPLWWQALGLPPRLAANFCPPPPLIVIPSHQDKSMAGRTSRMPWLMKQVSDHSIMKLDDLYRCTPNSLLCASLLGTYMNIRARFGPGVRYDDDCNL